MLTNDGPGRDASADGASKEQVDGRPSELAVTSRVVGRSGRRHALAAATRSRRAIHCAPASSAPRLHKPHHPHQQWVELVCQNARAQSALVGLIFLFVFIAYLTIQGYASQLYGADLASQMETTLYAVFTLACFVAPPVTNRLGTRVTMCLGVLGYGALVGASLLLAIYQAPWCRAVVVVGGGVLGVGAALLWTAQGRFMLEWAEGADSGRIFAIFWGIFNLSALIGGLTTSFYFSTHKEAAPAALYIFFLACIVAGDRAGGGLGAADARAPPPPTAPHSPTPSTRRRRWSRRTPTGDAAAPPPAESWLVEARRTVMMFFTPRMAMLAPLFWYTGFNQPYQLNTYGNRFFDSRALGIELAAFYAAEIAGGWVAGLMLDNNPSPVSAARRTLALFALATALGNALAGWGEVTAALVAINGSSVAQLPLDDVAIVPRTFAFLLWGFSDSQVQAYSYWLIRLLYEGGAEQARAVGFYKMVQSLGWTIG